MSGLFVNVTLDIRRSCRKGCCALGPTVPAKASRLLAAKIDASYNGSAIRSVQITNDFNLSPGRTKRWLIALASVGVRIVCPKAKKSSELRRRLVPEGRRVVEQAERTGERRHDGLRRRPRQVVELQRLGQGEDEGACGRSDRRHQLRHDAGVDRQHRATRVGRQRC